MKKLLALIASLSSYLAGAPTVQAQNLLGQSVRNPSPFSNIGALLSNLLQLAYFVAGLAFFIYLLIGGLQWIMSGGEKAGTEAARNKITAAFIGLVIVVAAYAITLIVEQVLGVKILTGFQFLGA